MSKRIIGFLLIFFLIASCNGKVPGADARKIPEGIGRQLQEIQLRKESYTPGDIHDINGKRIYMKPADD